MKKAIQQRLLYLSVLLLSSCAFLVDPLDNGVPPLRDVEPAKVSSLLVTELKELTLLLKNLSLQSMQQAFKMIQANVDLTVSMLVSAQL